MAVPTWLSKDLKAALEANRIFAGSAIELYSNENSDLVEASKECSKEFFSRVFAPDGPLWAVYAKTRMGYLPKQCLHANFVGGRLYFARNVEKRFMRSPGPEKSLAYREGKVVDVVKWTPENFLLALSMPFDSIGFTIDIALLGLYVNEKMRAFQTLREESVAFLDAEIPIDAPWIAAAKAMDGAVRAMEYSFTASLAMAFNTPIADSPAWKECEIETLNALLDESPAKAAEEFGFHSASPYDISVPRLSKSLSQAARMRIPAPKDKYVRWRENARIACSRFMAVARKAFLAAGKESGLGELIFHLQISELSEAVKNPEEMRGIAAKRKADFEAAKTYEMPPTFVCVGGKWFDRSGDFGLQANEKPGRGESTSGLELAGISVGVPLDAMGTVVWINSDEDYGKDVRGKIIASRSFSPSLATLFSKAAGVVSMTGGRLAHCAIVARETGLVAVVQVQGLASIREGQNISLDGKSGKIRLL